MPLYLIMGIVMAAVPALIMIGFAFWIFISFIRDDKDASNVARVAFIIMIIGILLIAFHFLKQYFI